MRRKRRQVSPPRRAPGPGQTASGEDGGRPQTRRRRRPALQAVGASVPSEAAAVVAAGRSPPQPTRDGALAAHSPASPPPSTAAPRWGGARGGGGPAAAPLHARTAATVASWPWRSTPVPISTTRIASASAVPPPPPLLLPAVAMIRPAAAAAGRRGRCRRTDAAAVGGWNRPARPLPVVATKAGGVGARMAPRRMADIKGTCRGEGLGMERFPCNLSKMEIAFHFFFFMFNVSSSLVASTHCLCCYCTANNGFRRSTSMSS